MKKLKTVKKILALSLVFLFLLSAAPLMSVAGRFSDVLPPGNPAGHWAYSVINKWSDARYDVLTGNPNGTFDPDRGMTLAELAAVFSKSFGYTERVEAEVNPGWARDHVQRAMAAGIIDQAAAIDADVKVTREEAIRYMALAYDVAPVEGDTEFADDDQIGGKYKPYVNAFSQLGYISGKPGNLFDPKGEYLRAEVMATFENTTSDILDLSVTGMNYAKNVIVRSAGVTLENTVIEGSLIIAQGVGSGEVTLRNVTVKGRTIKFSEDAKVKIPQPVLPNTFSPNDAKAGSGFERLADIEDEAEWFVLLAADNPSLPYNMRCYIGTDEITVMVPSGVKLDDLTVRFNGLSFSVDGKPVVSGGKIDAEKPVTLAMTGGGTMTLRIETLNTGLPSVSITSRGNTPHNLPGAIDSTRFTPDNHRTRHNVHFTIGGGSSLHYEHAMDNDWLRLEADLRGRGNSSWNAPKRQYNLRLRERDAEGRRERPLLGMASSARWVIQANWEDKTLMRNHLGHHLSAKIGLEPYCDVRYVDLWFNGEYWGAYYLMERVDVEENRVNIPTFDDLPNARPHEIGYLLEFDQRAWTIPNDNPEHRGGVKLVDISRDVGSPQVYFDPYLEDILFYTHADKWAIITEPGYEEFFTFDFAAGTVTNFRRSEHIRYIVDQTRNAAEALGAPHYGVAANPDRIRQLLDLESFVQWYIVSELMDNTDSSMHSSVNMYLPAGANAKFKMGPVWDFDRSTGNCNYWFSCFPGRCQWPERSDHNHRLPCSGHNLLYDSGAGWFYYLFRNLPEARALLRSEWAKFNPKLDALDGTIVQWAKELEISQKYNFEKYPILGITVGANNLPPKGEASTYADYVTELRNYMATRRAAMDAFITGLR
jgi:hypothetical protein